MKRLKLLNMERARVDVSVHESKPETRIILVFTDNREKDSSGHFMEEVRDNCSHDILIQAIPLLQEYVDTVEHLGKKDAG